MIEMADSSSHWQGRINRQGTNYDTLILDLRHEVEQLKRVIFNYLCFTEENRTPIHKLSNLDFVPMHPARIKSAKSGSETVTMYKLNTPHQVYKNQ
ncbi:hypothetical protein PanWU01x14_336470, partial [Parasponia andersonii]